MFATIVLLISVMRRYLQVGKPLQRLELITALGRCDRNGDIALKYSVWIPRFWIYIHHKVITPDFRLDFTY